MGENITAKKKKSFFGRMIEKLSSYIWRILRFEFLKVDKSEDIISGIDVRDYFGPKVIELSSTLPIAQMIMDFYDQTDNVTMIGIERKGFALLGAILEEIERDDIEIYRNRNVSKTIVKGKNIILFDDAAKTGKTIIKEVKKLKKLEANEVLGFVILTTKEALKKIHTNDIDIFYRYECDKKDYSKLYSAFYDIVNSSVIPVTGEPVDEIIFKQKDRTIIPYILSKLKHGEFYLIDSYDASSPIRASIDYYDYVNNGGHELFDNIGKKTGLFITLDQVKIRLFFSYKFDNIIIKLKPILYFDLPENVNCKQLEECKKRFGKYPSGENCRDCIEKMLSDILINDLKKEIKKLK
ncbi:MAG: phosphoribosyltransferase [Thermoplasmata archaeon]|nr:MAG: phosphoribosyltransferase [Thermoplasmata archaeon]